MFERVKRVFSKRADPEVRPILSIVVVVYDMPVQAQNTLVSLSPDYQEGVSMDDFEVIVVENESPNLMNEQFIESLPRNTHYYKREETQPTPVHAINFGALMAKGDYICIMVDGARVLTPGVVKNILLGHRVAEQSVVSIPGYHLGEKLQQESVSSGYGLETERELIRSIGWPGEGYRLFDISCFSGTSAPGFFLPNAESNCISVPRNIWFALAGYDVQFDLRGGGFINLDFYKRACEHPDVQHVIIPGEGTFHQFHGGVTTGGEEREVRLAYIEAFKEQYRELRGEEFSSAVTNPIYVGQVPGQSQRFLYKSSGQWLSAREKSHRRNLIGD